jgi:hypothetical protein
VHSPLNCHQYTLHPTYKHSNVYVYSVAKQKYKVTENKLKRQYQNQQGHMMNTLRRKNPNKFYRKFKRVKKQIYSDITIEQF